jgi:hypothetical protein
VKDTLWSLPTVGYVKVGAGCLWIAATFAYVADNVRNAALAAMRRVAWQSLRAARRERRTAISRSASSISDRSRPPHTA